MDLASEIDFFVNGIRHRVPVSKFSINTTLNTFLRDELLLTGTKKMCEEGGCGVCTVVRKIDNTTERSQEYLAINSCLVSLLSCQGWDIYTIEGIGNSDERHAIQERLITFNGSQCGYCTPGMVMNMYALQQTSDELKMKDVENSFAGNICRCTGYRSILAAFKSLCNDATPELKACLTDIEEIKPCNRSNIACHNSNGYFRLQTTSERKPPFHFLFPRETWIRVYEFNDLLQVIKTFNGPQICMLVAGNTAKGVYKRKIAANVYVDVSDIAELRAHKINENFLSLGANVTLTDAMRTFKRLSIENREFKYLGEAAKHIDLVATVPIRNIGTIAGNLMIKHSHNEFPSDVFLILETCQAKLKIVDTVENVFLKSPSEFLKLDMTLKVLKEILLPKLDPIEYKYGSYKIMPRTQNAHALQNAGFLLQFDKSNGTIKSANIVYGHVNKNFVHASKTEHFLKGNDIFNNKVLQKAFSILNEELVCEKVLPEPDPEFRRKLAVSLFYKFILSIAPEDVVSKRHLSGKDLLTRPVSTATQDYDTSECLYPLARGISKVEAKYQVTGEAEYVMDKPNYPNQLFAAFVLTKARPGSEIITVNIEKATKLPGFVVFFDKNSIPGKNTFTPLEASLWSTLPTEEELFCSDVIRYYSQPLGIVVAESHDIAQQASELVEVDYKLSTEKPIITIRDAINSGDEKRTIQDTIGKPSAIGQQEGTTIISGTFDMSWQYHYHMETQCCSAFPNEDGIDLYPASQWMDLSQNAAAAVLNIPANKVNVSVKRLGGGFGAKIVRSSIVSCAAALACYLLKKPIKMWLPLETNMRAIGKRYPISSNYKMMVDDSGLIQGLENKLYYDHGSGNNEGVMFLLFDIYTTIYNSSTWYTNCNVAFTDTPASCYTRAPGSAEGLSMLESIMEHTAMQIGMDPLEFKMKNLSKNDPKTLEYIKDLIDWANIAERKLEIEAFNVNNKWRKKGLSVVPMLFPFPLCFGFGVIVSVYHADGTVAVAHGGIEIGQGLNTKVIEACAYKLGIPVEKISVKHSNNLIAPNASMTGSSLTSESICWAVIKACDILLERMEPVKKKLPNASWEDIVKTCYKEFIHLCATSMFQGPKEEKIKSYTIYGVCASEIELDVLTGQYQITRVDLLEDVGDSMNPAIDIGQVEGAFMMGLGYFCTEQIITSEEGEILTNRTWNYKPPGAKDIPIDFRIKFPKNNPYNWGVLKSKAVGEPPFCLAVSVPLAIRQAVASVRKEFDPNQPKWYPIDGPSTVENTYMNCLHNLKDYVL